MNKLFGMLLMTILMVRTEQCGFSHHIEISIRALSQFRTSESKEMIERNMNYFYGGSPFPDWAYLCPVDGIFNEYAHWPPFTENFIKYIKGSGFDKSKKEKLTTFLMGVVSHMESDVLWHWGENHQHEKDQGFLRAMSHMGSYCRDQWNSGKKVTCHNIGDIGGELYLRARGNLVNQDHFWSFPIDDIINVYDIEDDKKYKINSWKLRGCLFVMYVARHLEWLVSEIVYQFYSKKATFLTENIHQYYSGGLDDNALQVEYKMHQALKLLEKDYIDDDERFYDQKYYEVFQKIHELKVKQNKSMFDESWKSDELEQLYKGVINVEYFDGDLHFSTTTHKLTNSFTIKALKLFCKLYDLDFQEILDHLDQKNKETQELLKYNILSRQIILKNTALKQILRQENTDFGYFGSSLVFGDFEKKEKQLIVSCPGFIDETSRKIGRVYKYDSIVNLNSEDKDFWLKTRSNLNSQFGQKMVAIDLNNDGYDDLVVSAPLNSMKMYTRSIEEFYALNYTGLVNIYLGSENGVYLKTEIKHSLRSSHDSLMLGSQLQKHSYNNNQYLVMGSPYAYINQEIGGWQGEVIIFKNISSMLQQLQIETDQGQYLRTNISYEGFGKAIAGYKQYLIIGAPGYRGNQDPLVQATGKVYIYDIESLELVSEIVCDQDQAQFGDQIVVEDDVLVVSAKSQNTQKTQAGVVYIFDWNKIIAQKKNSIGDSKAVIRGQDDQARFGGCLKIVDNELLIGAPLYSSWNGILKYSTERGAVFFVYGFKELEGEYKSSEYSRLQGQNSGARFGSVIEYADNKIFISAPFESYPSGSEVHNRFRGAVYVYNY